MSVKYYALQELKKIYLRINILRDFNGCFHHFFRAALLSIGLLYFFILHANGLRLPPRFNRVNAHPAEDWCLNHQL